MNLNKDPESWARVSPEAAAGGSQAQAANVIKMAVEDIAQLHRQLERANQIIGWMMPYIGSMCPPPKGLADLNIHCCENRVPEFGKVTKGPSLRQHAAGARPSGIPTR